jgi:two-component system sensor histidine kinase PilS (NtrC family)
VGLLKKFTLITDSEDQLRHHLLWLLFIRVMLYTLLLGITHLLHAREQRLILPPPFVILTYLLVIYSYSIVSALILQKKGLRLRRFGLIQMLADTLFIALLVYATGCSQSIFTALFILPVIAGGLIMYRIGGLMSAAAATILYGLLLSAEYLQFIPAYFYDSPYFQPHDYQVSMNVFAVHGLTFFLIAMISGIIASRLRTTEDALTLSEMRLDRLQLLYKQIFDDIQTGIITVDNEERITSFNPSAVNITGFSAAEVQGRRLYDLFPTMRRETVERSVADLRKKNGDTTRVGYSCSELHMNPGPDVNEPACTSCKVITLQDISRVEEMEKQVRQAEKMAAIGDLSALVAHDFRNPLAAISGSAQILSMELQNGAEQLEDHLHGLTRIIVRETDRMARTVTDFLHYARPKQPDCQWFNLERLVAEAIDVARQEKECAGQAIEPRVPDACEIFADRDLLQLALVHLLKNACHASAGADSPVRIAVHDSSGDKKIGKGIAIEIRDQGSGLDPSVQDTLLDPFVTTREDTAGLGLAIVRQIAAKHSGSFTIANHAQGGCSALLILPLPETTP